MAEQEEPQAKQPETAPLQPQTGANRQAAATTTQQEGQAIVGQTRAAMSAKKAMLARQKAFLEALERAQGNISLAAQLAGIDRDVHYRWLHANKEYMERFEKAKKASKQARVDMALARVMELVAKSDHKDSFAASKLVLENEGQDYGYGQKPQTAVQVNTQVNTGAQISIEQFRGMAKRAIEAKHEEEKKENQ